MGDEVPGFFESLALSKRIAILEFPSAEQAKAWYHSPGYSAIKGIRQRAAIASLVLVPGV